MIEQSLVLIKPDGVQRGLIGEVIKRFENVGLKIVGMKMQRVDKKFAERHYPKRLIPILGGKTLADWEDLGIKTTKGKEELGKQAWNDLIKFTTEGPILAFVLEGVHAVQIVRKMVGHTSPHKADPGTIRGDYSPISMGYATVRKFGGRNLIHASGTVEEAKAEVKLWFKPGELHTYKTVHETHTR